MSIVDVSKYEDYNKQSDELTSIASEYGLVCFKIEYAKEKTIKISGELIKKKFELEDKLKQLLYA